MRRTALVAQVVALALALGCGKKAEKRTEALPAIEGIEALPKGVTRVVGGDVEKLLASRMVRRGVEGMLAREKDLAARLASLAESCALEPGENVLGFIIGLGDGPTDSVMAIRGKFVENALAACVGKAMTEDGGRLVTKTIGGRSAYIAHPGSGDTAGDPVYFAVGSPSSLVVAASEPWLAKALGEGPRMTDDPEMASVFRGAPTEAGLWAVGQVPAPVAAGLAKAAAGEIKPPRSMVARLELTDVLEAELRVEFPGVDDAKKLKSLAELQRPAMISVAQRYGLGTLLEQLSIEADKNAVVLRLSVTEAELSELLAAVDTTDPTLQNPASPDSEGPDRDDQGNPAPDGKAPLRR